MRRMLMEESQIFRIIPRGNMDKKKARGNEKSERGVKKKSTPQKV